MHTQIDSEQPLESFLGFRKTEIDDGRLTVEELLKIRLKKGSLMLRNEQCSKQRRSRQSCLGDDGVGGNHGDFRSVGSR